MKCRLVLFVVLVLCVLCSLTSCVASFPKPKWDLPEKHVPVSLNEAVSWNDTGAVLKFLANGANPNEFDSGGNTPLVMAVTYDNFYLVNILLAHGANPNMATKYGSRPLPIAVEQGYINMVNLLLDHGANPTLVDMRRAIHGNEAQGESYNLVLAAQEKFQLKIEKQANGNPRKLLAIYLSFLRQVPDDTPLKVTYKDYKRAILSSRKIKSLPPLSEEYRREIVVGLANVKNAKTREDYLKAIRHFVKASRIAPWSPAPYEALGHVSESVGDYASAADYFKLYLLAAPNAPSARAIRDHIYVLEDKAGAQ